jgi:hypothetical protein
MNAKITLSVDIKDVPEEINNILLKVEKQLNILHQMNLDTSKEKSELKKLSLIKEMRRKLSLLDASYDDCYTVLVGLLKHTVEENLRQSAPSNTFKESNDKQQDG